MLPITLMRFSFSTREDEEAFLTGSQLIFGKKYLRFRLSESVLLLVGIRCTKEDAKKAAKLLDAMDDKLTDCQEINEDPGTKLTEYMEKWDL